MEYSIREEIANAIMVSVFLLGIGALAALIFYSVLITGMPGILSVSAYSELH
ncbi:hypothetical protein P7H19_17115 [Paenibacillus larvae]|nr:hypothetical protein [Paenibacillus larvae]